MTDRERCYPVLRRLKEDGVIEKYIATQLPNGRWGFRVTMPDDTEYLFLPREVLAFAEGARVVQAARGQATA